MWKIIKILNIRNFWNHLSIRYSVPFAILPIFILPVDINFIFYSSDSRKSGRSTFARSLIFKFEISAILKFYCSKFWTSPNIDRESIADRVEIETPGIIKNSRARFVLSLCLDPKISGSTEGHKCPLRIELLQFEIFGPQIGPPYHADTGDRYDCRCRRWVSTTLTTRTRRWKVDFARRGQKKTGVSFIIPSVRLRRQQQ